MPRFIACTICKNRSGIINVNGITKECPTCGTNARNKFNIPQMIGEFGWTTPAAINYYYNNIIMEETSKEVAKQLAIFRATNPNVSNSQIKKQTRYLQASISQQISAKYPMIND